MQDFFDCSLAELEAFLLRWKMPPFHSRQVYAWIYHKGTADFSRMNNLPLGLRKKLHEEFCIGSLTLAKLLTSLDGTQKSLFELRDHGFIEAVVIPTEGRITGCISSQAGCKFGCVFCASGMRGFRRNLTCGEILAQVFSLKYNPAKKDLTHIVFMGTGEPFDNYDACMKAIRIINSEHAFHIGARRITISSCGVIPGIQRLSEEDLQVELSVSLHAADNALRSRLMPINRLYPLPRLLEACREYIKKTNRQITFEYALLKGINSDLQNAKNLSTIVRGLGLCKVNLIPANCIPEQKFAPPDKAGVLLFRDALRKAGVTVTLRKERGQDIDAACGQLRLQYEKR